MSMEKIVQLLSDSNSPAILFGIGGAVLIFFLREYFRFFLRFQELRRKKPILKEKEGVDGDARLDLASTSLEVKSLAAAEPDQVVSFNFTLLEKYYEQHLIEYKLMSRASLVIAALGFVIVTVGVFLVFADKTSAGVLTSIAGIVAEGASVLFFNQNKVIMNQVQEYHKKLVSTQYLLTAVSLAKRLPGHVGEHQVERIIGNLLFLSNVLHGSKSDHLFSDSDTTPNNALQLPAVAPLDRAVAETPASLVTGTPQSA